jgi:hypothetical protein
VRSYSLVTRAEATIGELQARLCSLSNAAGAQSGVLAVKPKRLPGEDLVRYLHSRYLKNTVTIGLTVVI